MTQGSTGSKRRNIQSNVQPNFQLTASENGFRPPAARVQSGMVRSAKNSQSLKNLNPGNWNERIGLPISTYNEKVFKHYRLMFDHL
jgi:hypothetical protein